MFTKEINEEIVNALKLFGPLHLCEHEKWKSLYLLLSKNIREIKRVRLTDFKEHVVKLLFDIKKHKFRLDTEHVQKICYPHLTTLLQFKVAVRSNPDYAKISDEKLARQKIVIKYLLSKHFNQELWNDMHRISEQHPEEYYSINIKNPQYALTTKEKMILNRMVYREKPRNGKNEILVLNQNKWLGKKIATAHEVIGPGISCSDAVEGESSKNVHVGFNKCLFEGEYIQSERDLNNQHAHVKLLYKVGEEGVTSDINRNDQPKTKAHERTAITPSPLLETEVHDTSLKLEKTSCMGEKHADKIQELSSDSDEDKRADAIQYLSSGSDEGFTIPYSIYDNLSADSDSETERERQGCKESSSNQCGTQFCYKGVNLVNNNILLKSHYINKSDVNKETIVILDSDDDSL